MARHSACACVSGGVRGRASSRRAARSAIGSGARVKPPPPTRPQDHAAEALRVVLAQSRQRLDDLALTHLAGVGEALDRDGLGGQEQQRLDRASEVVHDGTTVIGPNGTSCSHFASPAL